MLKIHNEAKIDIMTLTALIYADVQPRTDSSGG